MRDNIRPGNDNVLILVRLLRLHEKKTVIYKKLSSKKGKEAALGGFGTYGRKEYGQ